jgi:hypothetical protein
MNKIYTIYKRAHHWDVENYFLKKIPDITPYQKERIRNDEIFRCNPFFIYIKKEKTTNPFIRLTVLVWPLVWFILMLGLPFNYLVTGRWGYGKIEWFVNWSKSLGI